jgi:hypothetical protein
MPLVPMLGDTLASPDAFELGRGFTALYLIGRARSLQAAFSKEWRGRNR